MSIQYIKRVHLLGTIVFLRQNTVVSTKTPQWWEEWEVRRNRLCQVNIANVRNCNVCTLNGIARRRHFWNRIERKPLHKLTQLTSEQQRNQTTRSNSRFCIGSQTASHNGSYWNKLTYSTGPNTALNLYMDLSKFIDQSLLVTMNILADSINTGKTLCKREIKWPTNMYNVTSNKHSHKSQKQLGHTWHKIRFSTNTANNWRSSKKKTLPQTHWPNWT